MLFRKKEINLEEDVLLLNNTNDILMYLREMHNKIKNENIKQDVKIKIYLGEIHDNEITKLIAINESEHVKCMGSIKDIDVEFTFHMCSNTVKVGISRGLCESKTYFKLNSLFKQNKMCRKDLKLLCICSDYIVSELNEKLIKIVSKKKADKKDIFNVLAQRKYNKV